ncbi:tail spike protein [Stappia phage SI01]|uniref:Tail spike protein n=1 Tax=Stappia phage SI01 TaxID=2847766 RepID=A0AAE7SN43_9CAUD|nr:tail spike protein [Stappia phage SI01]
MLDFALGYLNENDVTCRVGGEVDGAGAPVYRDITFLSETLVQISGAAPGNGVQVVFDRTVEKEDTIVHFSDGDVLDENNLDLSFKQILMVVHEALDGRTGTYTEHIDMGGYRIKNLGAPVDNTDAANKAYVDGRLTDNLAILADTEVARDAAQVSAAAAQVSADAALTSENKADTYSDAAFAASVEAENSEILARLWATEDEDVAVAGYPGQFSARHWALKAAQGLHDDVTISGDFTATGTGGLYSNHSFLDPGRQNAAVHRLSDRVLVGSAVDDTLEQNRIDRLVFSITRAGTTASVITDGVHGFSDGQKIILSGAAQPEYNGTFVISNVTANGFDYTVSGAPATPATADTDRVIRASTIVPGTQSWIEQRRWGSERLAQMAVLATDGNTAFLAAARTSDGPPGGDMGAQGGAFWGINDTTDNDYVYALSAEARRDPGAGTAQTFEGNIANGGDLVVLDPIAPFTPGATMAAWLASGGEQSTNLFELEDASVALGVVGNGARFMHAIMVGDDAVRTGGSAVALSSRSAHELAWFYGTPGSPGTKGSTLKSSVTSGTYATSLHFTNDGLAVQDLSGTNNFLVVTGDAASVNGVRVVAGASGLAPTVEASGPSADISLGYSAKGAGKHEFNNTVRASVGSNSAELDGAQGFLELVRSSAGGPGIDLKRNGSLDYEGRIYLDETTGGMNIISGIASADYVPTLGIASQAGTLAKGVSIGQVASGTVPDDDSTLAQMNTITITDDVAGGFSASFGTHKFVEGMTFSHSYGGTNMYGGRNSLAVYSRLQAPSNAANGNRNYCALTGVGDALTGDGGTALTYSDSKGAIFGGGATGGAAPGATNLHNVTAWEFNTAMRTDVPNGPSSVFAKSIIQLSGRSDDSVEGTGVNSMIWMYNQAANALWDAGLHIDGDLHTWPIKSGGDILRASGGPAGPWRVRDDGSIFGDGYQIGGDGNGAISLGKASVVSSPYMDWNAGFHPDFDVRIQVAGGDAGTPGRGTMAVTAGTFALASGTALQLGNAYAAGAPTPTGYIVVKDSTGTEYKIPAEVL